MSQSQFTHVAYIRATPEAVWAALTDPDLMKEYWFGMHCESEWTAGASWRRFGPDGTLVDAGAIVAFEPARRMSIRWRHQKHPELSVEGDSLCTMNLEAVDQAVKVSIVHTIERQPSALIAAVSDGWPKVVSNLKSYLETGSSLLPVP